jgi:hypothetical protein
VTQTQEILLIQLELKANPTPTASWYLDNKDLNEVDPRYSTKIEKKSADSFLLSLEIKVSERLFSMIIQTSNLYFLILSKSES